MSLADAWGALLADARGLVPDREVRAAITTEIGQLGQLAAGDAAAVEDHIARWLTGAYTGPSGVVGSPAGQAPAGLADARPADAEPGPAAENAGVVPPDQVAVSGGPAVSTVTEPEPQPGPPPPS